ncbi:MAG: acyl carrier protein, partial [Victivallales bacterium]|nr:acyl carrier protein [Victivallales bacterium]
RIAGRLRVPRDQIQKTTPFLEFGIGSLAAVQIAADLGCWLGRTLSPTTVYNHPTIGALAAWLAAPPCAAEEIAAVPLVADAPPDADQLLHEIQSLTEEDLEAFIQQEMAKPPAGTQNTVPGSS